MADKTPGFWTSYQGRGGNSGRGFGRGRGNSYVRGRGFNPTKLKVRGKCEALGSDVYYIWDARQADKYTKTTEAILNYIQGNFNEGKNVKEALEELNHFDFNIIKPKTPDSIPVKGLFEEMILGEEVKNWFVRNKKDGDNMHKTYALILGQCTEGLNNKLHARKIGKHVSIINQLQYLKQSKKLFVIIKTVDNQV